ncbi:conserved Plasmodium protein, unknown function [Plasmodium malariae]|uniref:Uncharacterized protein n=1 Tax=Plasmodium malariae TaxID=5858 RepID=A0A1C3KAY2_PLAMA|nr:conserved Plasmodium protein, unknown function [Plasmodium malariae]
MFYLYNKLTESSRKSHNEKSNSNVRKEKDVIFSSDGNMYRKKHREEDYKKDEDFFLMFEEKERNEEKKKDTEREMDVKWKGNDMKCERIDVTCEGAGVTFEWIATMCEGVGESSEQPDIHTDNVNAQCEQLDESGDDFFKIDEGNFSTFTFAASYDTKRNSVEGYSGNTNYECKRSDVINEENYENPSSILNVNISFADNGRNLLLSDEKKELQNDNSESLVLEKTLSVPTLYKNEAFFIPHKNLTQSDDNVSEYKKEKLEFLLFEDGNKNIKKDEHSERGYTLKEVTSVYSYNHNSVHVKSEKEVSINEKIKTEFLCSNISEKNISHESLCKKMNSNSAVTYGNLDGENERKADTFNINFIFAKTDSEGGKMGNSNDNKENKRGNLKEAYSHNNAHNDVDYEANDDKYNSDVHSSVHNDIPNSVHNDIQNGVPNTNVHISRNNLKDDSSEFSYFFHSNKGDGNLGEQIFVNKNLENLEKIIEQDNNRSLLGNILGGKKEIESSHVELENGNDNEVLEKSGSVNSETMEVGSIKSGKYDEQFIWESPSEVKGIVNGKEKIYSENKDVVEVDEAAVEVVDLKDEKRFESKEVAEEEEVVEAAVDYGKEKLFESKEMVEKEKVVDKKVEYIEKKQFESKEMTSKEEAEYVERKILQSKEFTEEEEVVEYEKEKKFESKETTEEEAYIEEKPFQSKGMVEEEAVKYEKEKKFESKETTEEEAYIEEKPFQSKGMVEEEVVEYEKEKLFENKEMTKVEEMGDITAKINDFGTVEMYETEKILEERRNFASFEDNSLERIELKNSKFNELNENNNKLENINERNMTKVKMCESVILEKREENEKKCENKKLSLEEINEIKVDKIFNIKSIEEEKKKEAIFSLNKEHAHSLIDEGYEEGFLLSFELNNSKRTFGDDNININNTIKEQLEDANTEMSYNHFLNILNEENIHRIYDVKKELNCSQKNSLKEEREFSINEYKKNVLYEQNGNIINHINNSYLNNKLQSGRNNGRSEFTKDIEELEIAMRKCNEKEVDRNDKVEKRITLLDMEHTANLRKVEHEEIIFKYEKKKKREKRNKRNKKHINRYLFNITKQFEYESNSLQYLKALKELPPLKFLKCKDMKPFLHLFNIVLKVMCEHYRNEDFVYVLAGDETGCIYVKLSLKHKEFCEAGKNFILANCCSSVEGYRIILEINEYSNIFLLKYNTIEDVNKNINFSDAKFVTLSECRI